MYDPQVGVLDVDRYGLIAASRALGIIVSVHSDQTVQPLVMGFEDLEADGIPSVSPTGLHLHVGFINRNHYVGLVRMPPPLPPCPPLLPAAPLAAPLCNLGPGSLVEGQVDGQEEMVETMALTWEDRME